MTNEIRETIKETRNEVIQIRELVESITEATGKILEILLEENIGESEDNMREESAKEERNTKEEDTDKGKEEGFIIQSIEDEVIER